ncbi:MAG: 30S ribosomal protein S9 [SAR202 cluster bacterium]|jgi:small subunit ribosomal protein S9|nr:30S ribosomal protein S9 [SAR202 cluster bacterium]|tara:strand:- start:228 stop:626 length:399 start_codon:yes stop_codon:yes gene_type:complete
MVEQQQYYYGTGRRKSAVARVRLYKERGPIVVNGKPIQEIYSVDDLQRTINHPFKVAGVSNEYRVVAKVSGGGLTGQAGALSHGISRALCVANPDFRTSLKKAGLLTRDSRVKESKKYGLKKARKAPQYTKR